MEMMGITVIVMAGILVLFVAIVLGIGGWILLRAVSALEPIKEMLEKHVALVDKLVTIVVAKGPLEYSSMRAADSLVSYDGDSSSNTEHEESSNGEETGEVPGDESGDFGDPFIDGTWTRN